MQRVDIGADQFRQLMLLDCNPVIMLRSQESQTDVAILVMTTLDPAHLVGYIFDSVAEASEWLSTPEGKERDVKSLWFNIPRQLIPQIF